jgi:hypothetical protein
MKNSIISLEKLSRIVEHDIKAWYDSLEMLGDNDESIDRIGKIFSNLIIHHIETGIGQMNRGDRNLIITGIERGDSNATHIVLSDRLRNVYINTLRNRLNRLDKLGDAIKEQLDTIGVDYTDDDEEE